MSWDQPAYSFGTPNAQPPTPTKTPTFAHLPSPVFQTPRNNRSSFEDRSGWTPTFAEEYSVFNSTPGRLTSSHSSFADTTPRPPPTLSLNRRPSNSGNIAAELATHVHHFSPNPSLPLPPVDPSNLLPSSPGLLAARFDDSKKKVTPRRPKKHLDDPFSAQTATPPHTASKGTRKLAPKLSADTMQNDQDGYYGTSQTPTHGPNMMNYPSTTADFFNYPLSAPATAPVFTSAKPFWDPDHSMDGMDIDFNADNANMFNTGSHRVANSFDWGRNNQMFQEGVNNMEKPNEMKNDQVKMKRQRPLAPKVDLSELLKNTPALPEFQFHDPNVPRVQSVQRFEQAVDPADLWTRASNPMTMAPPIESVPLPPSRPSTSNADMQPYSQQVRESLRDQEEYLQDKMRARRKYERGSASSPIRGSRPSLQRSMSESRGRRRSQERVVSRSGGRVSPQKRIAGLSSIPETAPGLRTEVEFVIDSNGRARMENVIVRDRPSSRYEDEDSLHESSSEDEAIMVPSRVTSFEIPQPHAPRHGRFETSSRTVEQTVERRYSVNNSYSRSESSRSSQRSTRRGSLDSEAETVVEHDTTGDATQEIRKLMETRKQNHYKAQNSMQRRQIPDLRPRPRYANYASSSNASPSTNTDPEGATPSSSRSGTTRCVCHNPDSEGFMIQCESCDNWLHTECVGIDQNSLPPVYICAFCAQTPIKRGPRLRDTARINNHISGSSPLAHKSFQSFR